MQRKTVCESECLSDLIKKPDATSRTDVLVPVDFGPFAWPTTLLQLVNKMQTLPSVPPPSELDETRVVSDSANSLHYVKT